MAAILKVKQGSEWTDIPAIVGRKGDPGPKGNPGDDGYSPTVTVTDITGGHRVTITDATGPHSFDVMDGQGAVESVNGQTGAVTLDAGDLAYDDQETYDAGTVGKELGDLKTEIGELPTDVQVNGTSVVDAQGVANVPIGTYSSAANPQYGVFRVSENTGIQISNGVLLGDPGTKEQVRTEGPWRKSISVANADAAAFYGMAKAAGDTTQKAIANSIGTYTDSAKSAISTMLNSPVFVSGTTPTITALPGIRYVCGEVTTLDITLPASGCVDVVFESGTTATVLTITPPSGVTLKWANGFDPTALEADTTYEINIADGLGVAGSWT